MINLHLHTEYSLLDSIIKVPDLVKKVKSMGQNACAITDHGTLGGFVEFYKECKKEGIKPIFGCEFYHGMGEKDIYHIVLLARNKEGFNNLIRLNNEAITNYYKKPRITTEMMEKYSGGLICLSGCMQGYLQQSLLEGNFDMNYHTKLMNIFNGDFWLEIQDNGVREQQYIKDQYLNHMKFDHCVATIDSHYLNKEDVFAHEVSLGIMVNKSIKDPKAFKFNGEGYHIKSDEEMRDIFPESAIKASQEIADSVEEFDIGYDDWKMPVVEVDEKQEYAKLEFALEDHLFCYHIDEDPEAVKVYYDRLKYEFGVIKDNGFLSYFKIIADLCKYFDDNRYFRGWGRGSAAGSLVSFLYGITRIDPIEWGLYFERFLNPDRISPPDIDLDFMPQHRSTAIEYLQEKYGEVYRIGTYGTLGTKEVIKSSARIMGIWTDLANFVPEQAPVPTVVELLEDNEAFKKAANHMDNLEFVDVITTLEQSKRNCSVHASGVIISDGLVPLRITRTGINKGVISTTWDMYALEDMKYVKFDILGLTNLQVIDRICSQVFLPVKDIPLDDDETFELIRDCNTVGVFQWEGDGFKKVIKDLEPDTFDELLDLNTLYRPGCLESGLTAQYIRRKKGQEPVEPLHPLIKIKKQQGLPLYQEDIMKMAVDLASFTLSEADILRKAIGKKIKSEFERMQGMWIDGCCANGIHDDEALKLWDMIEKFARYTWNKAHSVSYTLVSWWTAYLSAHYPEHFFCELLNAADSADRRRVLFAECRKRNIEIIHPDINKSDRGFKVVDDKILIGLTGIKYVGPKTLDKIFEERVNGDYDKGNFKSRTKASKRVVEYLEKAGAFGDTPTLEDEKEALGFNVKVRMIDTYWWSKYMRHLGEIIDVHKITTKKGDPMAFINVEFVDRIESLTVFPQAWEKLGHLLKKGKVGIYKKDHDGILVKYCDTSEIDQFKVHVKDWKGFLGFNSEIAGTPTVWGDGIGLSSMILNDELLKFINGEFGIEKLTI